MTDGAALAYLVASGAAAISILDDGSIKAGAKLDRRAVMAWRLPEAQAITVSRTARKIAGDASDVETMAAALQEAAAAHGIALTEHDVAMARARSAVARVESFMASLQSTGRLRAFNELYKAQRQAAVAQGRRFISYGAAMRRLRVEIGARLAAGGDLHAPGMLAEVFR
jgi:hypothetical protein